MLRKWLEIHCVVSSAATTACYVNHIVPIECSPHHTCEGVFTAAPHSFKERIVIVYLVEGDGDGNADIHPQSEQRSGRREMSARTDDRYVRGPDCCAAPDLGKGVEQDWKSSRRPSSSLKMSPPSFFPWASHSTGL